jgi:hypothetical protein
VLLFLTFENISNIDKKDIICKAQYR